VVVDTAALLLQAAETAAGRPAAEPAEEIPEAGRMAALLAADTVTTKNFHPVSPHSSLTVRRLRKEPPVLPKLRTEMGKRIWHENFQPED